MSNRPCPHSAPYYDVPWPAYVFCAEEATLLDSISRLRDLQHLSLSYIRSDPYPADFALQLQYAPYLQRLGSLTALRRLHLSLPHRRRCDVSTQEQVQLLSQPEGMAAACSAAWDSQQAAFAAALRCMPHLQSLTHDAGFLGAKDLAGCTALTHLQTSGLLLAQPSMAAAAVVAAAAAEGGPANPWQPAANALPAAPADRRVLLPPQLQELRLEWGASPQVLAAAARLQALRHAEIGSWGERGCRGARPGGGHPPDHG